MSAMDALFTVQDEDTIVRQLNHRHANLPERRVLAEAEQALGKLATAAAVKVKKGKLGPRL